MAAVYVPIPKSAPLAISRVGRSRLRPGRPRSARRSLLTAAARPPLSRPTTRARLARQRVGCPRSGVGRRRRCSRPSSAAYRSTPSRPILSLGVSREPPRHEGPRASPACGRAGVGGLFERTSGPRIRLWRRSALRTTPAWRRARAGGPRKTTRAVRRWRPRRCRPPCRPRGRF
jgi:hypothetical protein